MPRRSILLTLAAAAVLGVAVVIWLVVFGSRVVIAADGVEVTFDRSAFAGHADPVLSAGTVDDEFVEVFGLPGPGPEPLVASLRAAADPAEPVEIAFDVFLDALPDDATPAVFHRDEITGYWLPVHSLIDDGRVVGTIEHTGDYVAGVLTAVPEVWRGIQWLRFQVGTEPVDPACTDDAPVWLLDLTAGADRTVRACAEANGESDLVLRVAPARGYAVTLNTPSGTVTATPGGESVLTWPAGELPAGSVTIGATPTEQSALYDTVLAGALVLHELADAGSDPPPTLVECLDAAGGATDAADAAVSCLDPYIEDGGAAAERIASAIRTGVTIDTAGQPAPAAAAALQSPGEVVLELAAVRTPPDGATALHQALLGWQSGQSGNHVAALIGEVFAPASTTQWMGCEDVPAVAYYALDGHTRFTGLLGSRDYMPDDIVAEVRMLVDNTVVTEFEAGTEPVEVDVELPEGDVLAIEAHRIAGECDLAPDGYLVWGAGALSDR